MEDDKGEKMVIDLDSEDSDGDEGRECNSTNGEDTYTWQAGKQPMDQQWNEAEEDYIDDDLDVVEVMNMSFDSEQHAYEFYNLYGKIKGFSIKKADVKHNEEGIVRYRKFACSREGTRHKKYMNLKNRVREPRPETRTGCMACLRIKYENGSMKYVVTDFVKQHNHKMASRECVAYLRSHRKVSDADCALANTMRTGGAKICGIMKFFAMQCGGYSNVGFVLKDLYNRMDSERKKYIEEGDAEAAIAYLTGRKATDHTFYFDYDVDGEGRLRTLFWADAESRVDYEWFGDVLVFDSTYKSNGYHKPLVVFAGVNNHFNTVIFGSALVSMERVEEYEWVLSTFSKAMGGKKPISVVTDGDKAMQKAIKMVFPESRHRLCTWHLNKNADVYVKSKMFKSMFAKFMKKTCPLEDFEEEWFATVWRCGLLGNEWVGKMYERRELWAEPLLRLSFFAGMRSTQRCEGMNAFLKRYLKETMRLFECVRVHELAVEHLRHTCARAIHETEDTTVVLGTELRPLEQHAAEVYSRRVFLMVKKHLERQGLYVCMEREQKGNCCKYLLSKYADNRTWIVRYNKDNEELCCSCMKMVWKGLPCAHMFRVMVMENFQSIPHTCIVKRWTRNARESSHEHCGQEIDGMYNQMLQNARYGALAASFKPLCFYASHMTDGFEYVSDFISIETTKWRRAWVDRGFNTDLNEVNPSNGNDRMIFGVLDPTMTVAKGDHKSEKKTKSIKCGNCGSRDGHNKRTCPKNNSSSKNFTFPISTSGLVDKGSGMEASCQQVPNEARYSCVGLSEEGILQSLSGTNYYSQPGWGSEEAECAYEENFGRRTSSAQV